MTVNSGRCRENFEWQGRGGAIRRLGGDRVCSSSLQEFGETNLIALQKLSNKKKNVSIEFENNRKEILACIECKFRRQ